MEVHNVSREDASGIREAMHDEARSPRILCWNCRRLTPFHEDRCEYCGARFAGGTGGAYASARTSIPSAPSDDEELAEARRSLIQLFEDLQRVHDVSSAHHYDPVRDQDTITLFQCPSCGRFVSGEATDCVCGVRFADDSGSALCPECGAHVSESAHLCPVCRSRLDEPVSEVAYACPVCGAEVSADAVQCACGARFEA